MTTTETHADACPDCGTVHEEDTDQKLLEYVGMMCSLRGIEVPEEGLAVNRTVLQTMAMELADTVGITDGYRRWDQWTDDPEDPRYQASKVITKAVLDAGNELSAALEFAKDSSIGLHPDHSNLIALVGEQIADSTVGMTVWPTTLIHTEANAEPTNMPTDTIDVDHYAAWVNRQVQRHGEFLAGIEVEAKLLAEQDGRPVMIHLIELRRERSFDVEPYERPAA